MAEFETRALGFFVDIDFTLSQTLVARYLRVLMLISCCLCLVRRLNSKDKAGPFSLSRRNRIFLVQ